MLVVCTGNLARSPMAERMLRAELAGAGLEVRSAGVRAPMGLSMAPYAAQVLAEIGIHHEGFESRQLDAEAVGTSALILTATRSHRSEVLEVDPSAVRRIFTLREFARLASLSTAGEEAGNVNLDELVTRVAASRPARSSLAQDDDIDDPYGGSLEAYRSCRDLIRASVAAIAPTLRRCAMV